MSKKKKSNWVLKILGVCFIIYIALYIANMSGYYESKIRDKVVVTEKSILRFEEAINNGEDVDIESFLETENIDYSSKISRLGDNLTEGLQTFAEKGMRLVSNILKSLF